MFCKNCGNKIEEDSIFCVQCGTPVEQVENTDEGGIDTKKIKKVWNSFGYIWTVIVNIITVFVVVSIYDSLYDDFEIIVVSLLILIYLSIQTFIMTYGNILIKNAFSLNSEFNRIRKLIQNNEDYEYEENLEKEDIEEAHKKTNKAEIKMYINAGFAFIIYLIALYNLFGVL